MAKSLKQNLLSYYRETKSIEMNIKAILNTENYGVILGADHNGKVHMLADIVSERLKLLEEICVENNIINTEEIFK